MQQLAEGRTDRHGLVPVTEPSEKPRLRGLGDVVAKATSAVGIKPCAPCKRRQEALNRLVPFGPKDD